MEQLSEQDAGFLYLETPETPQHVGGVSLVQLPPDYGGNFYDDYKRHIAARMHLIPLMHRKLVALPFDIDHPYWTEDDAVDVDYHIRQQTLPSPGRPSQLEELVGRLHSNFLDRSRPLWEFYVIQGLESGQLAIYTKIHHAAMDGGASQHLMTTMYDPTPVPRQLAPAPPKRAHADAPLSVPAVLRGLAEHAVRREIRALQAVPDVLKALSRIALPDAGTLKFDRPKLPPLRPPRTRFNVAISSQRAFAARSLPLARFKRIARLADVKLNDVVLAVCSAVLRGYLKDHGELPRSTLTAMVPVSLREAGDTQSANQNAAILCSLATDVADPVKRLAAIRASTGDQKKQLANMRDLLVPDLSLMGTAPVMRGVVDLYRRARLADRLPPLANLPISNVPGPPVPLYIAGARLLTMSPCSMPYHGQSLNITVESYCDALDFGLVACRRTVPDLAELADRLLPALDELEAAVLRKFTPTVTAGSGAAAKAAIAPAKRAPRKRVAPSAVPATTVKG
ncbi:MAG: wax ester/triacylglycerol synthase family O-acyltransferase [Burkholderiaceae bacterium]|nr:wax ester/triacylglycerol synthase family O-acyltransferase [Burkholderiaceae bacterium]